MKLAIFLVFAALAFANAEFKELETPELPNLVELKSKLSAHMEALDKQAPAGAGGELATYLPEAGEYSNPSAETKLVPTIPNTPQCTVRGQTIFEIRKMRADAKQIGVSIMYEIQTMEKRKAYIEQMTAYLNDRIRELNKVKRDLAAEQKWIGVSNQRIAELAQKEKLIKLQDVMACIKSEQSRLTGESATKTTALATMDAQAKALEANIGAIRGKMNGLVADAGKDAAGTDPANKPAL